MAAPEAIPPANLEFLGAKKGATMLMMDPSSLRLGLTV